MPQMVVVPIVDLERLVLRNFPGDTSKYLLNDFIKLLWVEKPSLYAMSIIDRFLFINRLEVCIILAFIRYSERVTP